MVYLQKITNKDNKNYGNKNFNAGNFGADEGRG